MELGGFAILPAEIGGGPGPVKKVYSSLRDLVGIGGAAKDPNTVEDAWRYAKAIGLASQESWVEHALWQNWPSTATDRLKNWSELVGVIPGPGVPDETVRKEIIAKYATRRADGPGLAANLRAFDANLTTIPTVASEAIETVLGRAYQDFAASEPFGNRFGTAYPNFSGNYFVRVRYTVGATGIPDAAQQRVVSEVGDFLHDTLPAWVTWNLVTGTGFKIDSSPLGHTGL